MANIPEYHIDNLKEENQARNTDILNRFMSDVIAALNGGVDFGSAGSAENTRTYITSTIKFTAANETFSAAHTLGRVPNGFVLLGCSATTAAFYDGATQTSAVFFVKSDTADVCASFLVL